jgi:hypothetical protein
MTVHERIARIVTPITDEWRRDPWLYIACTSVFAFEWLLVGLW